MGRDEETLPRAFITGDRSGSIEERGDTPRDEGLEETEEGREEIDPWFLTADACVRKGLLRGVPPPSRGGVAGTALVTGVFDRLRAKLEDVVFTRSYKGIIWYCGRRRQLAVRPDRALLAAMYSMKELML